MPGVSSTTSLLLLSQRIDLLQGYFGWIIGGVTLTITVLIALFVTIQFTSALKIQKEKIELLEKKLMLKISQDIDNKAIELQAFVEESFKEVEDKVDEVKIKNNIETARLLALTADHANAFSKSFYWWMRTAALIKNSNGIVSSDNIVSSLKAAKKNLEKIQKGTAQLKEDSSEIQTDLKMLADSYPIEIENLKKIFTEKIT